MVFGRQNSKQMNIFATNCWKDEDQEKEDGNGSSFKNESSNINKPFTIRKATTRDREIKICSSIGVPHIAQWICLRLSSGYPWFESQVHHLCFHLFFELYNVEKTKINKKGRDWPI